MRALFLPFLMVWLSTAHAVDTATEKPAEKIDPIAWQIAHTPKEPSFPGKKVPMRCSFPWEIVFNKERKDWEFKTDSQLVLYWTSKGLPEGWITIPTDVFSLHVFKNTGAVMGLPIRNIVAKPEAVTQSLPPLLKIFEMPDELINKVGNIELNWTHKIDGVEIHYRTVLLESRVLIFEAWEAEWESLKPEIELYIAGVVKADQDLANQIKAERNSKP